MRVDIPIFETKNELFAYLKENKRTLISKKKSMPIFTDTVKASPLPIHTKHLKATAVKADNSEAVEIDKGRLRVRVVANAHNMIDSHMDVLLTDSAKKTLKERKGLIPHLKDHIHQTSAEIGEVVDITLEDVLLSELGYNSAGKTQCVIFTTDIIKEFCEKSFARYKNKRANQHSIGLQYVKLYLCINSDEPEYTAEKENFDKYYSQVINKEVADEMGYFWAVTEYKLIENSMVLFGSNPYTPTLEISESKQNKEKPSFDTSTTQPSFDTAKRIEKLKLIENKFKDLLKN